MNRDQLIRTLQRRCVACKKRPAGEVLEAHGECHGWFHCECCGECPSCVVVQRIESDFDVVLGPLTKASA